MRAKNKTDAAKRDPRFTLIELLVTIAIVAILAAILLPALGNARDTAKTMVCGSNLKQLLSAAHLYGSDYGNWLPTACSVTSASSPTGNPITWGDSTQIGGYFKAPAYPEDKTRTILWCPSEKRRIVPSYAEYLAAPAGTAIPNFAVCYGWTVCDPSSGYPYLTSPIFLSRVSAPSTRALISDNHFNGQGPYISGTSATLTYGCAKTPLDYTISWEYSRVPLCRHHLAFNIGFLDGHSGNERWFGAGNRQKVEMFDLWDKFTP